MVVPTPSAPESPHPHDRHARTSSYRCARNRARRHPGRRGDARSASLAYQFRLDWGVERSRAFRFVTIDEAFSRGSEESTRYALELFTRLGLQLMIVTPLQKIRVIDPYVSAVGFVDNPTGAHSRLQGLTITEYRRRQAEHLARSGRAAHG